MNLKKDLEDCFKNHNRQMWDLNSVHRICATSQKSENVSSLDAQNQGCRVVIFGNSLLFHSLKWLGVVGGRCRHFVSLSLALPMEHEVLEPTGRDSAEADILFVDYLCRKNTVYKHRSKKLFIAVWFPPHYTVFSVHKTFYSGNFLKL